MLETKESFNGLLEYSSSKYRITKKVESGDELREFDRFGKEAEQNQEAGKSITAKDKYSAGFIRFSSTIAQFKQRLKDGHGVGPSVYNGELGSRAYMGKDNWEKSQFISLDFDSGISWEYALEICKLYQLNPLLIYLTFSYTPELPKFRIIFALETPITNLNDYINLVKDVGCLFKGRLDKVECKKTRKKIDPGAPDKTGESGVQYIFPGRDFVYESDMVYNTQDFLKEIDFAYGICPGRAERYDKDVVKRHEKREDKTRDKSNIAVYKTIRNWDWVSFEKECNLYRKALNEKLEYHEFWHLAFSLIFIEGGKEKLQEIIQNPNLDYDVEDKLEHLNYASRTMSRPPNNAGKDFLTAHDASFINILEIGLNNSLGFNMDLQARLKRTLTLGSARLMARNYYFEALQETEGIFVLDFEMGVGKTTLSTNTPEKYRNSTIFCHPTHKLCQEFIAKSDFEVFYVLPLPELKDKELRSLIDEKYATKRFNEASNIIKNAITNGNYQEDRLVLASFLQNRSQLFDVKDIPIVMTHEMAFIMDELEGYDTIIFDENINVFKQGEVVIGEVKSLYSKLKAKNTMGILTESESRLKINLEEIIKVISLLDENKIHGSLDLFNLNDSEEATKTIDLSVFENFNYQWISSQESKSLKSSFNDFGKAKAFLKHIDLDGKEIISFMSLRELPKYKKVIIMSGTPYYKVYNSYFKSEYKTKQVYGIMHNSEILWNQEKSCSKTSILNLKSLSLENPNNPTIAIREAFQVLKKLGINVLQKIYYGCQKGTNDLEGKDMNIIGYFRLPEHVHAMQAICLGLDIPEADLDLNDPGILVKKPITIDGLTVNLRGHRNEKIKELQLEFSCAELDQALGRSRFLEHKVKMEYAGHLPSRLITKIKATR